MTIAQRLIESWPSPLVARTEVGAFSGGVLHPRTMANIDAKGQGPAGKVLIGGKVAYDRDSLALWVESRLQGGDHA